jgi:hypothetical protein
MKEKTRIKKTFTFPSVLPVQVFVSLRGGAVTQTDPVVVRTSSFVVRVLQAAKYCNITILSPIPLSLRNDYNVTATFGEYSLVQR